MSTLGLGQHNAHGGVLINLIDIQSDNRAVPGTVIQLGSHLVTAFLSHDWFVGPSLHAGDQPAAAGTY